MGFDTNIQKKIKKLTKEKAGSLNEKMFYESFQLTDYLQGIASTMTGNKKINIRVYANDTGGETACTNGNTIFINYVNELCSRYVQSADRFSAFMGFFYHEMSHVLYMDFDQRQKAYESIASGRLYGNEPEFADEERENDLEELKSAIAEQKYIPIFLKIFHDLDNILSDRHDEDSIIWDYPKLCTSPIMKIRESLFSHVRLFDDIQKELDEGKADKIAVFYNTLLQYTRFDTVAMADETLWEKSEILSILSELSSHIETAQWTDDIFTRYTEMNYIVLALWKYIRDVIEDKDEEDSQEQENSRKDSGLSDEDVQGILNSLAIGENNSGITPEAQNVSSSKQVIKKRIAARKGLQQRPLNSVCGSSAVADSEQAVSGTLKNISTDIAQNLAEEEIEEELNCALNQRIQAVNKNSTHQGIPVDVIRDLNDINRQKYEKLISEIRPYSKRLQKLIRDELNDMKEGSITKHKAYGRILVIEDTYRQDGLCYANKKLPKDVPEMALSILVDNSGSMDGERLESAIKAAVLLYDFATGLGIPVSVSGHSSNWYNVNYKPYADFERAGTKDKYRIAAMTADGCNRDGLALEIASDLLSRRPEEVKLLIVISDGQPNASDYGGEEAAEDIRSIVRKYRNRGIEILAAAIGDDRDLIKSIYGDEGTGEGFINISNLEKLPKTLTSIVKKRILAEV